MRTSIAILLLLLLSCGKEVRIDSSKLEEASKKSNSLTINESGTLHRSQDGATIENDGKMYKVSKYSSHLALSYISTLTEGEKIQVKYRGEIKNAEIILEMIASSN